MKSTKTILLGGLVLGLLVTMAGCSSISVNYDYDVNSDWDSFKTYAWYEGSTQRGGAEVAGLVDSDLLDKRIRSSVDYEMAERGLAQGDDPDLLVIYHVGAKEKIQVTDWGYRYSDYYWGYGGRQIDVYQFTEGTLVIDIIDADTKNLVWRGTGTGAVDRTQRSPEEMQGRMDKVVNKIMNSFPPK